MTVRHVNLSGGLQRLFRFTLVLIVAKYSFLLAWSGWGKVDVRCPKYIFILKLWYHILMLLSLNMPL